MLTPTIMGLFCLAIMWTATLLIAAVAASDLLRLLRRRARVSLVSSPMDGARAAVQGTVSSTGTLATLTIDELGRARPDRRSILFHPRRQSGAIEGGTLRTDDGLEFSVPPLDAGAAEVWRRPRDPAPTRAFAEAHAEALKARGFARTITHVFAEGDRVYVAGALAKDADGRWTIVPTPDPTRRGEPPTLLVSAVAPRAWYSRKIALSALGIAGVLGSAALVTVLACIDPSFGLLTAIAGVLGLGQFLAAQPVGVALREAIASPDRAVVHHDWAEPAPRG